MFHCLKSTPVKRYGPMFWEPKHVVAAAANVGVQRLVFISTDKAVHPSSVMGASKRVAEDVVLTRGAPGAHYCAVRFGNVLGSRGSVIPTFLRQIEAGGPVTITDPRMTRFFMSIPEAVQLVLQAATMSVGGEVFILEMGKPVTILDLAQRMIRLAGRRVGSDIEIRVTGVRPGEKLFEELHTPAETLLPTAHPSVLHVRPVSQGREELDRAIVHLLALSDQGEDEGVRHALLNLAGGGRFGEQRDVPSQRRSASLQPFVRHLSTESDVMDPLEYITVVRRRWRLVVACAVVAVAVGWVLMPAPTPQSTNRSSLYEASVALISPVSADGQGANVSLVALVTTSGDVPRMAAEKLGYTGDPDALAMTITATPDPEAGTVRIVATGSSAEQASATAVAFAESATAFLRDSAQQARDESLSAIQAQLDAITQRVDDLDREIVVASGPQSELLAQQKAQELQRYGAAYAEARQLAVPVPETAGLQSVGAPNVARTGGGIAPPSSVPGRLLLFGGLGLVLGAFVALIVDRLDTRLRNRDSRGRSLQLAGDCGSPESGIGSSRRSSPVITSDPGSLVAEAYRSLRSTLLAPRRVHSTGRSRRARRPTAGAARHFCVDTRRQVDNGCQSRRSLC